MKEILEKLSSYNIFNYLLPGAVFAFWLKSFKNISLIDENLIVGAFVFYFLGMVVSRFGSLIIEPILKWTKIVQFEDYVRFVRASQKDSKIDILSEMNNMYRTFISLFVLIGLIEIYFLLESKILGLKDYRGIVIIILLIIMFLLSYRKQANFISKRIKSNLYE